METSFYHDERGMAAKNKDFVNKLKSKMTLDFDGGPRMKKPLLASPDLNMLKLASPELEKLIIQHNGMVTTPTPTQILFPKSVTEEQEAYARGFVDALAQLHNKEEDTASLSGESESGAPIAPTATLQHTVPVSGFNFTTVTTLPGSVVPEQSRTSTPFRSQYNSVSPVPTTVTSHGSIPECVQPQEVPRTHSPYMHQLPMGVLGGPLKLKEEPQTVPSISNTPPISPINMESQEKQKVERKRARNRVAARKCRYRKLERISRLETRVSELKNQNTQLAGDATSLKEQVLRLKQQILEHVHSGCNIMVTSNVL